MMNWKDCLNSLKLSITNTIKILLFILIFSSAQSLSQQDSIVTTETSPDTTVFEMQKSPWGAVLRSAIVPGLGQIYNESYWKAPIVWGFMGYFVYVWIDNNNKYIDYSEFYKISGFENDKIYRDFYRDQRDEFAIYIVLTYFLNLVDAYVDAHLFDFTVEENKMLNTPMIGVKFNF